MYSRKLALSLARQFRTCPPPPTRNDKAQAAAMRRHLRVCPHCTDPSDAAAWSDLADLIRAAKAPAMEQREPHRPAQGEIWQVREDLARWRGAYFYGAPLVLVCERTGDGPEALRVCQMYHDAALAAPGDLLLPAEQSPLEGLFVECWNDYTLRPRDLSRCVGNVGEQVLRVVADLAVDPDRYPPWAVHPRPFVENDPRTYFRELEVEVGYTFASVAVQAILAQNDKGGLREAYETPQALQDAMKKAVRGASWASPPESVEEALALVRFPPEQLPLAAAKGQEESLPVTLAVFEHGRLQVLAPLHMELFHREPGPGETVYSGRIRGIPGAVGRFSFVFFLATAGGVVRSSQADLDPQTGDFIARFPVPGGVEGTPAAAVFAEKEPMAK